jgi:hypothetical protein
LPQKYTGSSSAGFLIFAGLAVVGPRRALTFVKGRMAETGVAVVSDARI